MSWGQMIHYEDEPSVDRPLIATERLGEDEIRNIPPA